MAGRKHAAVAFRPSAPVGPRRAPSRVQLIALLTGMVLVAAGIAAVSFLVKPSKARSFDLFYGSVLINDNTSPVAVDLASGKPTVRLRNAFTSVSAKSTGDLDVVPLAGGNTLMLNPGSGEFNMVDSTGFVVKTTAGGVRLPMSADSTESRAIPAGSDAYVLQSSSSGSSIYLVGQLTVASAIGANAKAKARAYASLAAPVATLRTPAVSANGDLWLLTGGGSEGTHTVTQLSVPAGSNTGVTLAAQAYGTVAGAAALGSATRNTDGTGGDVAAVASSSAVRVFIGDSSITLPVRVAGTVDDILAASNAQGQLAFLYHSSAGWFRVTAPTGTSGSARVSQLDAIDPGAQLVTPTASDGHLYTMDTLGSGALWQVDDDGTAHPVVGAAHYPALRGEQGDLAQAEVMARGSRVIFNARANYEAEVVFSDGSHAPRVINKHSAVQVDPTGATALADAHARGQPKPGKATSRSTTKPPRPEQAINDKVDCKTTTQTPHIPTVQLLERGSRSVGLSWNYPLLAPGDCAPSTYTVTTKLLSSDAPSPPSTVTVQGQDSVTLTGLFPDTEYQLTVTAYLNKRGTPARPLTVRTDIEGPAAPTNVHTTVDSAGNWTVQWTSCGGVKAGCVPVADWQVIPRLCDGKGLASAPATQHLAGDPTLHSWKWTYQGNDGLLGRGLGFTIEGVGTKGTVGAPTSDKSCSYSWTKPVGADITVTASAPARTATSQETTDTTVAVQFAKGQVHDLGGVGGQLSYQLLSHGSVVSRSGPTTRPSATLSGITAGNTYQVVVRVNPPGHPEAAVTLAPVNVQPAVAAWPRPSVTASFANTSATSGTLTVTFGLNGANPRGERFDLVDSGLDCGNARLDLQGSDIAPGSSRSFPNIDRFVYNSGCTVSIVLVQDSATATAPPLYGAGSSARATSAPFTVPPPSVTTTQNDFTAAWNSSSGVGNPQVVVNYRGNDQLAFSRNWSIVVSNGSHDCGNVNAAPPVLIAVDRACVPGATKWTVTVSYQYFLSTARFTVDVAGSAPEPVDPTKMSFTASWSTSLHGDPDVVVHYNGPYSSSTLSALSWTETVTSNGVVCGTSHDVPSTDGSGPNVQIDYDRCPPSSGGSTGGPSETPVPPTPNTYALTVHYDDRNYGGSKDYSVPDITGVPPH